MKYLYVPLFLGVDNAHEAVERVHFPGIIVVEIEAFTYRPTLMCSALSRLQPSCLIPTHGTLGRGSCRHAAP